MNILICCVSVLLLVFLLIPEDGLDVDIFSLRHFNADCALLFIKVCQGRGCQPSRLLE